MWIECDGKYIVKTKNSFHAYDVQLLLTLWQHGLAATRCIIIECYTHTHIHSKVKSQTAFDIKTNPFFLFFFHTEGLYSQNRNWIFFWFKRTPLRPCRAVHVLHVCRTHSSRATSDNWTIILTGREKRNACSLETESTVRAIVLMGPTTYAIVGMKNTHVK